MFARPANITYITLPTSVATLSTFERLHLSTVRIEGRAATALETIIFLAASVILVKSFYILSCQPNHISVLVNLYFLEFQI